MLVRILTFINPIKFDIMTNSIFNLIFNEQIERQKYSVPISVKYFLRRTVDYNPSPYTETEQQEIDSYLLEPTQVSYHHIIMIDYQVR